MTIYLMSLDTLRHKLLSDPKVKKHSDRLKHEFDIAKELIHISKCQASNNSG